MWSYWAYTSVGGWSYAWLGSPTLLSVVVIAHLRSISLQRIRILRDFQLDPQCGALSWDDMGWNVSPWNTEDFVVVMRKPSSLGFPKLTATRASKINPLLPSWNHLGPIRRSTHMKSRVAQSQAARKGQQPSQPRERNGKVWIIPSKAVKNGHITNENLNRGFRMFQIWSSILPGMMIPSDFQIEGSSVTRKNIKKSSQSLVIPLLTSDTCVPTAGIQWLTLSKNHHGGKGLPLRLRVCQERLYVSSMANM